MIDRSGRAYVFVFLLMLLASCAAPPVLDDPLCIVPIDSCKPQTFDKILIDTGGMVRSDGYRWSIELLPAPVNTDGNDHAISFYGQGKNRIALVTNDESNPGVQSVSTFSSPGYLPNQKTGTLTIANSTGATGAAVYSNAEKKIYYTGRGGTTDPSDYDVYVASPNGTDPTQWIGGKVPALYLEYTFDAQPALSPDGKRIYFASERLGGTGGVDLWMASRASATAQWSIPQPLPSVNTLCNELSPSVSYDGKWLYFASNGHATVGGYDIFRARLDQSGEPGVPENIGKKVNTTYDELFPYQPADTLLYFSSDQPAKFAKRNIYVFHKARIEPGLAVNAEQYEPEQTSQQKPTIVVEGNVVVAGDTGKVDAEVFWRDPKKDVELGRKQTDTAGNFSIELPRGKEYDVGAESKDKFYDVRRVDTRNTDDSVIRVPTLVIGDTLILRINFPFDNYTEPYDFTVGDNGEQTPIRWQSHLEIISRSVKQDLKRLKRVILFGHTDTVGSVEYNNRLARNRAEFVRKELIKRGIPASLVVVDPQGELHPLAKRDEESLDTFHLRLRRVEIVKVLK